MNDNENQPFAAPASQHDANASAPLDDPWVAAVRRAEHLCPTGLSSPDRWRWKAASIRREIEAELAAGAAREGGNTSTSIVDSSTAPIAEDELPPLPTLPRYLLDMIGEYGMARTETVGQLEVQHRWEVLIGGIKRYAGDYARAALASKPAAREAARQSIDTRKFRIVLDNWAGALHSCDHYTRTAYAKQAYNALVAHIDVWGGAAPAAGNIPQ